MPRAHPLQRLRSYAADTSRAASHDRIKRDYLPLGEYADTEWRAKFEPARRAGQVPKLTVRAAISRYIETVLPRTRPQARFLQSRNRLLRFAETLSDDTLVSSITPRVLSDYRDRLIERGLKNSSTNSYIQEVISLLRCCCTNWEVVDNVPFLPSFPRPRRLIYMTEPEEERLLAQCPEDLKRMVIFMLGTGARKAEVIHLTWHDVQLDVHGSKRAWVVFRTTKNGRSYSVPLPHHVRRMLIGMKAKKPPDLDYVFTVEPKRDYRMTDGRLLRRKGVPQWYRWPDADFRAARDRAGLPHIWIHTLRHTYASRLVERGVSILDVSHLLNHATIEYTMIYAHLSPTHLDRAIAVLDRSAIESRNKQKAGGSRPG